MVNIIKNIISRIPVFKIQKIKYQVFKLLFFLINYNKKMKISLIKLANLTVL